MITTISRFLLCIRVDTRWQEMTVLRHSLRVGGETLVQIASLLITNSKLAKSFFCSRIADFQPKSCLF